MKNELKQTLDLLRERVTSNLEIIHENEKVVRGLLQNEGVSNSRSEKLQIKFNENKALLEENNDLINLQVSIIKLIQKYSKQFENSGISINLVHSSAPEEIDFYELTISGGIEYNENHPHFNDQEFYQKLMNHYLTNENYEMCSKLSKIKFE